MSPIHTISYVSTAKALLSHEALFALLQKSRDNNAKFGVTGMLLYSAGNFMQAIEGPLPAINQLYSNICHDSTHQHIIGLINEPITERNFSDWHMGYATLAGTDLSSTKGFYDIFKQPLDEDSLPIKASETKKLLLSFRQSAR